MRFLLVALSMFSLCTVSSIPNQQAKGHNDDAFRVPKIELREKLAKIFSVSDCRYISGLTCRIRYNGAAPLPSEVFFTEFDDQGRKACARLRLIYPKLKAGERGYATLRIRLAEPAKIVLEGEWNGPWRDPY